VCNEEASKGKPLDVHHRTYERRGAEKAEDVIVLCRRCHELFHTTVGVVDK
jgi:5-methylcytosine-specific restriction endonuclease McrA